MLKDRRFLGVLLLMCFALSGYSSHAETVGGAEVGAVLPEFKLEAPAAKEDQEYLGLKGCDPFTLSKISGKLVILEFTSSI
jgi:hypothetical protein